MTNNRNQTVKNYRNIFKNVFCEKESLTKVHYLYEGLIVTETQEGENHEAEELLIIKEKITDVFYCVNCNKEKRSTQNDSILERKDCGISRGYHFVAYKKFDYTLATFVTSKDYNEANVEKVIKNILNGIISLHEQKIFHYNINPDVIMIDQECKVKFLDFFLSRELKDRANKPVVPLSFNFDPNDYTSPELIIFRKRGIDFNNYEAPDMFSISCCIFFIYTLYNPFDRRNSHTSENILKKDFKIKYQTIDYILLLDEYKKPLLEDLVKETINYESSERLFPIKVLEHPFFWDCEKISQFFKENIEKIKNPNEYLKGKNFDDGRYEKLPNAVDQQELEIIQRGNTSSATKGNCLFDRNNSQITLYFLKKFPTLLYDLYKNSYIKTIQNLEKSNHEEIFLKRKLFDENQNVTEEGCLKMSPYGIKIMESSHHVISLLAPDYVSFVPNLMIRGTVHAIQNIIDSRENQQATVKNELLTNTIAETTVQRHSEDFTSSSIFREFFNSIKVAVWGRNTGTQASKS